MVSKRWRIKKHMLVPAQWNGSVQHFYHFFFGYFMPVLLFRERTGLDAFAVRDCGPMNPWFELLAPDTDIEFMSPGVMMHRVLTNRQENTILHGWDDPTRFHRRSLRLFADAVMARVDVKLPTSHSVSRPRILLLERRPSPEFFFSAQSEVYASGTDYRSLPDLELLKQALDPLGDVAVVDSAALSPAEQVRQFAAVDLLVAQHGAGLSNMVFMSPNAGVVEIKPPLQKTVSAIYSNLASAKRLDYTAVAQSSDHAAVPAEAVAGEAARLLSRPGSAIPTMTGSLPVRLIRQLPRRW